MLNGSRLYYKTIKCEKILPFVQLQRTTPPSGAPNDGFLLNTLKTLFRLSRVLLDLLKGILSDAIKFVPVRSS